MKNVVFCILHCFSHRCYLADGGVCGVEYGGHIAYFTGLWISLSSIQNNMFLCLAFLQYDPQEQKRRKKQKKKTQMALVGIDKDGPSIRGVKGFGYF